MDNGTLLALVGSSASLAGTLIGAFVSHFSAISIRKIERKNERCEREIAAREALFSEFLTAASDFVNLLVKGASAREQNDAILRMFAIEARCMLVSQEIADRARELTHWANNASTAPAEQKNADKYIEMRNRFIDAVRDDVDKLKSSMS